MAPVDVDSCKKLRVEVAGSEAETTRLVLLDDLADVATSHLADRSEHPATSMVVGGQSQGPTLELLVVVTQHARGTLGGQQDVDT